MYEEFFGLRERPFDLLPNPRFLFLAGQHREAFSNLRYGLSVPKGLTLLIGEAGTGKTTLVQSALGELDPDQVQCVFVSNPTLTRAEFYEYLATGFGLGADASGSKTRFLFEFRRHLLARQAEGHLSALVLDEAQSLPYDLLEEVRLLSNIETETVKLLNVILAGQPELAGRLNEIDLRQLKQRIALRCEIGPLDFRESAAYIAGRLRIAGGEPAQIFTREAILAIHEMAGGIPRVINVICDNALLGGFAAGVKPVVRKLVDEVCRDFDIKHKAGHRPAPAAASDSNGAAAREESQTAAFSAAAPRGGGSSMLGAIGRGKWFALVIGMFLAGSHLAPLAAQTAVQAPAPAATALAEASVSDDYVIGAEDVIGVQFWREPEMSGDVIVRPDGMITLPLLGEIKAEGLKPQVLRDHVKVAAGRFLTDANVTVVVRQVNSRKVYITGQVAHPGAYSLASPHTVLQAIAMAGGLTEYAESDNISIARTDQGRTRVFKFNYKNVSKGKTLEQNIQLQPGDTVMVP